MNPYHAFFFPPRPAIARAFAFLAVVVGGLMVLALQSATAVAQASGPSLASVAAGVSIMVGLCTIGLVLYRLGGHAQDLKNTKENIQGEMRGLTTKVTEGFQSIDRRFDHIDEREGANNERRTEWSQWRERTNGRLDASESSIKRIDQSLHDARNKVQAALNGQALIDQRMKPIEEVVRMRAGDT